MEHVVLVTSDLLGVVRLSLQAEDTGGTLLVLPQRMTEAGLILPRLLHQQFGDQSVPAQPADRPLPFRRCPGIRAG